MNNIEVKKTNTTPPLLFFFLSMTSEKHLTETYVRSQYECLTVRGTQRSSLCGNVNNLSFLKQGPSGWKFYTFSFLLKEASQPLLPRKFSYKAFPANRHITRILHTINTLVRLVLQLQWADGCVSRGYFDCVPSLIKVNYLAYQIIY